MKHFFKIMICLLVLNFISCDEREHGPSDFDTSVPADITNLVVTSINGGFDLTYDLPPGKEVLYVKVVYTTSTGEESEVRASAFNNKMQILGLGNVNETTFKVYTVNRAEISSPGVTYSGTPLTPVVDVVAETVDIIAHFGGVKISWINETEVPLTIEIFAENDLGELELYETLYSENLEGNYSLRGREPVPQTFSVVISDRYDNRAEPVFPDTPDQKLTPLFETRLDKSLFSQVVLDNDDNWEVWGASFRNLYDENPSPENWVHTQGNHARPAILTIDLGVEVKLSRFVLHQRGGSWGFKHANPKKYKVYGALEIPGQDGNLEDWILLGDFESIKPSGLPVGTLSNEDRQAVLDGDEHEFVELIPIRYVRVSVSEAWGGNSATHIRELTFYGQL